MRCVVKGAPARQGLYDDLGQKRFRGEHERARGHYAAAQVRHQPGRAAVGREDHFARAHGRPAAGQPERAPLSVNCRHLGVARKRGSGLTHRQNKAGGELARVQSQVFGHRDAAVKGRTTQFGTQRGLVKNLMTVAKMRGSQGMLVPLFVQVARCGAQDQPPRRAAVADDAEVVNQPVHMGKGSVANTVKPGCEFKAQPFCQSGKARDRLAPQQTEVAA